MDSKGKVVAQHPNPSDSGRIAGPLGNHLLHGGVSDPSVSDPTDMHMANGGTSQKKQNDNIATVGPLESDKSADSLDEFGPWTTLTHKKRPNNLLNHPRSQKTNKNKIPEQNSLLSSPENRRKPFNSSYSNGNITNKVWKVLEKSSTDT